eukprot:6758787-Pyramimonas_sp.AAC.1
MRAILLFIVTCVNRACLTWFLLAVQLLKYLTFQQLNLGRLPRGVALSACITSSSVRLPHMLSHVGCVQGSGRRSDQRLLGLRILCWQLASSASLRARRACAQASARIPGART